jgi:hypothetical protein
MPIHLLLDCYSAHRTEAVKQAAAKLGIIPHFISLCLSDEFHALDRVVFGVLKAQAKRFFRVRFRLNPRERRAKQHIVADMATAWLLLGQFAIDAACDIYRL